LKQQNIVLDHCIVGEPSNPSYIGEEIKVGRRGSLLGSLTLHGTQGHIAYPERADNPMPRLAAVLDRLCNDVLDQGTDIFQPSNLEVTSVDVGNKAHNMLPQSIEVKFGIRYNSLHDFDSLEVLLNQKFDDIHDKLGGRYDVKYTRSGEAFYTKNELLVGLMSNAITKHCGKAPKLSTAGGTSDARFIKNHCPTIEFGLIGATMHKIDEHVNVADIETLANIYHQVIGEYFVGENN
ncbi:MAG: M20/M25/M40 family metallo-hydrolase, partial [Rhizobiales bacterium]|nr:M20/M25/M40 family metallo-hydrolase [Hyphomicrobiales bacterium]